VAESAGSSRIRYRFSPLERRGVIAGWRGGQIASVAAGMLAAVFALRASPSVGGVAVAVLVVGGAVALSFWPIQGRTGEQWLPLVVRWSWARSTGSCRVLSPGPRAGHLTTVDRDGTVASPLRASAGRVWGRSSAGGSRGRGRGRGGGGRGGFGAGGSGGVGGSGGGGELGPFGGLDVVAAVFGPGASAQEFGMVVDRRARSGTAVLAVRGHSFALLGPTEQDARIAAWARVLAALAREGSEVHRVQWTESCLPDDGTAVRRHWAEHAVLGPDTAAGRSYRSLVDESAPVTRRHQVLVSLTVRSSRTSRSVRAAGGGELGIATVLSREVVALERALDSADITVEGVLGPGTLRRVIGEAFAPTAMPGGDGGDDRRGEGRPEPGEPNVPGATGHTGRLESAERLRPTDRSVRVPADPGPSWPWPMAVETQWEAVRTDATWHATYWIAEWPRVDVTPDFLGPLLFSPLRRTITVTMEPVSPSKAARQVAQARTADIADGELRRRGGFLTTARHSREQASVEDRDVELADGHAQFRFTGYVTVTADTAASLVDACAAVEQAAGHARVELRRLYGEQDVAFTCSLPIGRGLT
jgi:hypothetical protein